MLDWGELIKLAVALVAIIDIPGNVPVFLHQTAGMNARERRLTGWVAAGAATAVLLVFANAGRHVLEAFDISIHAFRVLGGLVVLLTALDMLGLLGSGDGPVLAKKGEHPVVVGVFPMAVPMFAGPGAIAAVMIYANLPNKAPQHDLYVSLIVLAVGALIALGLLLTSLVSRFLGPVTQKVLHRLLGIIVGAMGVEFMLKGIKGFFGV